MSGERDYSELMRAVASFRGYPYPEQLEKCKQRLVLNDKLTEAIISALCIQHGFMPGGLNTERIDPTLKSAYLLKNKQQKVNYVLSNSLGFGGSNCSLVFGQGLTGQGLASQGLTSQRLTRNGR